MGILAGFFVSFGSLVRILGGFFVSFGSWMGILGESFVSFGSWMRILTESFVSFGSRIGILVGSFASFGSWIRIPARFLILRAHPKADLYKDGLIFYRDSAALHEFSHVVASRNSSSFLSLMKEKKAKENQGAKGRQPSLPVTSCIPDHFLPFISHSSPDPSVACRRTRHAPQCAT